MPSHFPTRSSGQSRSPAGSAGQARPVRCQARPALQASRMPPNRGQAAAQRSFTSGAAGRMVTTGSHQAAVKASRTSSHQARKARRGGLAQRGVSLPARRTSRRAISRVVARLLRARQGSSQASQGVCCTPAFSACLASAPLSNGAPARLSASRPMPASTARRPGPTSPRPRNRAPLVRAWCSANRVTAGRSQNQVSGSASPSPTPRVMSPIWLMLE